MWRKMLAAVIVIALVGVAGAAQKVAPASKYPLVGPNAIMSKPPTHQGTPHQVRDIAYVYPQSADRWTGSTDGYSITETSLIKGYDGEVGWAKYDLSGAGIPSGAYIWSITAWFYVNETYWPYWCITHVTNDPVTADPATLYNDIMEEYNNSTYYSYNTEGSDFAPGWHSYVLGGTANDDFAAALSVGWFGLGVVDFDFSTTYYIIIDGWAESNPPYLEVEWSMEPPPTCVNCEIFDQCGPYPCDYWLADMAYDPTRGLMYQVEVDGYGSDIVIWNPADCSYCEAYDYTTGVSQRAIAYDPEEDVIYVGGWNQGIIYKFAAPQCGEPLQLLGTCDLSATPLWGISGLAWDDIEGGLYLVNSSDNQLGKVDFNTCTILYYGDITWMCTQPGWDPAAAGLAFADDGPGYYGLYAKVFDSNTGASAMNFFFRPEEDAADPYGADTACVQDPSMLGWGVGQEDGVPCEAWFSDYYTITDYHENTPCPPTAVAENSRVETPGVVTARPNPFTGSTEISFALKTDGKVNLSVFDASGRLVATLVNGNLSAGSHTVVWNAENVASGIYFYKLVTNNVNITKKLVLLK